MCLATKAYEQENKMCTWGQPTRSLESKLQPDFSYELKHKSKSKTNRILFESYKNDIQIFTLLANKRIT